jgi:hypothetical protein
MDGVRGLVIVKLEISSRRLKRALSAPSTLDTIRGCHGYSNYPLLAWTVHLCKPIGRNIQTRVGRPHASRVNGVGHHIQPPSRPTFPESIHTSHADGEYIS